MKKYLKIVLAVLSTVYMIVTVTISVQLIMGMSGLGQMLVEKTGLKVTEKFKGGRVSKVTLHKGYISRLHRPVFDGPFGESGKGFVQIDWFTDDSLPAEINEEFDYDLDGKIDFKLKLWPEDDRAFITSYNENVGYLVDKATVASFVMKGYPDARNAVFSFKNYEEAVFLGYRMEELDTLDKVKKLIGSENHSLLEQYLAAAREDKAINSSEIMLVDRIGQKSEPVSISYIKTEDEEHDRYEVILKAAKTEGVQQLLIRVWPNSDYVRIFPKTSYKVGKSVRVMLKNDRS